MPFVVPNNSEVLLLRYILNNVSADNKYLRLYTNDHIPIESDTLANYTESSAGGYVARILTGTNFTFGVSNFTGTATYSNQSFSFTTSASIYGYYITNNAGTELVLAERFPSAPEVLPGSGGEVLIGIKISLE